jgi:zinc protease
VVAWIIIGSAAACSTSARTPISKIALSSDDLSLELYQLRLKNGLQVLLLPQKAAATAVVAVGYRVGSSDEPKDATGVAHLLEHLMFSGTRRISGKRFDLLLEAAGGWNNAYTTEDYTLYYDVGPPHLLQRMLWLEADRMGDLANAMGPRALAIQKAVVLNEYRESHLADPDGQVDLLLPRLLYPARHPYSWAVIGNPNHFRKVSLARVKAFMRRFYVPRNACLVVAGRFNVAKAARLVRRYFAWIPPGTRTTERVSPRAVNNPSKARHTARLNVGSPRLLISFHSPAAYQNGDAEAMLLARVLGDGKHGLLKRRLVVDARLATQVEVAQDGRQNGGVFTIEVIARPGAKLAQIESLIDRQLEQLKATPMARVVLERAKRQRRLALLINLQRPRPRAALVAEFWAYAKDMRLLTARFRRWSQLTPKMLQKTARETFVAARKQVLVVLPNPQGAK